MAEYYKHIFVSGNVKPEKYKASPKPGKQPLIPPRDRVAHSEKLLQQFDRIWKQKKELEQKQTRTAEKMATRKGTYLSFTSAANHDLITKSLENIKKGILLLNVKEEKIDGDHTQVRAAVYIPNGMEGFFIKKITKYQAEDLKSGKPKNAPLVNSINDVSMALLEGLWTGKPQSIPTENSKWCEAWLNVNTKDNAEQEQIALFLETLENIGIEFKHSAIIFPERAVLLIYASKSRLIELIRQSDLLAEFRAAQEPAGFWVNESAVEQQSWADDLLQRIEL